VVETTRDDDPTVEPIATRLDEHPAESTVRATSTTVIG